MRTEKDGMHLVLRMGAVQAGTRFSSSCGILYAFGAIETMPTFIQAVTQDGSAMDSLIATKELPALGSMRERGSHPSRRKGV